MKVFSQVLKNLFLFLVGGIVYCMLEMLFRGHTHVTMVIVGGVCFLMCGMLNEVIPWEMPLPEQMLVCAVLITGIEFVSGVVLNTWLGLGIWDYSDMPFNIYGQVCLPFSVLWYFLSAVGIILDDYLRYWLFAEERPHYSFRRRSC